MDRDSFFGALLVINVWLVFSVGCVGYLGWLSIDRDLESLRAFVMVNDDSYSVDSAGLYDGGVIVVYADRVGSVEGVVQTCLHEAGHWVMHRQMGRKDMFAWEERFGLVNESGVGMVSDYSRTNFHEFFAESFSFCMMDENYNFSSG